MLNKAILMGRLTRDPELRHTQSNMAVWLIPPCDRPRPQGPERRTPDRLYRLRRMGPVRRNSLHSGLPRVCWRLSSAVSSPASGRIRTATTARPLRSTATRFPSARPKSPAKQTATQAAVTAAMITDRRCGPSLPRPRLLPAFDLPAGDSDFQELADDDGDVPF